MNLCWPVMSFLGGVMLGKVGLLSISYILAAAPLPTIVYFSKKKRIKAVRDKQVKPERESERIFSFQTLNMTVKQCRLCSLNKDR